MAMGIDGRNGSGGRFFPALAPNKERLLPPHL
jgi:hypothetical protein